MSHLLMPPSLPGPVAVRHATPDDERPLRGLWNLFRHDVSLFNGALPDAVGLFRHERLDAALAGERGWEAHLATVGPHPVAFAVNRALEEPEHVLTALFVVAAARRAGLGLTLARHAVHHHPGSWAVAFAPANAAAASFWPRFAAGWDAGWVLDPAGAHGPDHWVRFTVPPAAPGQGWLSNRSGAVNGHPGTADPGSGCVGDRSRRANGH